MHLWQIRHILNLRQTSRKLNCAWLSGALVVVSLFISVRSAAAQADTQAANKPVDQEKATPAEEFLDRVRQELPKHRTIKADLTEVVSIGDQQFKVAGEYLSSGEKLKVSYSVHPDQGTQGEMLEVCDGKELFTQIKIADSTRVTQRNVQQILAAAAASKKDVPESTLRAELGLGGLSALLASLARTMTFDAMKSEETDDHPRTILQGRWKKEFAQHFARENDGSLPAYVPDGVRIYVNSKTLFPEKILYLKKQPQKKLFRAMLSLEFRDVEFDVSVEDGTFVFQVPPGLIPEDVTKQYLDRLGAPATQAPATQAPAVN